MLAISLPSYLSQSSLVVFSMSAPSGASTPPSGPARDAHVGVVVPVVVRAGEAFGRARVERVDQVHEAGELRVRVDAVVDERRVGQRLVVHRAVDADVGPRPPCSARRGPGANGPSRW